MYKKYKECVVRLFMVGIPVFMWQVHLCEAEGVPEYNGMSSFHKKQVVVKSLWRGCSEQTK